MIDLSKIDLTMYPCYNLPGRPITLSWSRLGDWTKCKRRVRLIYEGKKSKTVNARNFLAGNVADQTMRDALSNASKDSEGRLLSLSLDELMGPLDQKWEDIINNPEKNRMYKWRTADPKEDQRAILSNVVKTLKNLHPILTKNLIGRRFIPEFRPKDMPVIGIPGPDGEPCYIQLFLAVDCLVQMEEDPINPNGIGKWGIFDLKTTPNIEYINQTLPQLVFYDIAYHALTGTRATTHGLWAPLMDVPERIVTVTDEHRAMVTDWIVSYCHSVWASEDDLTKDESNCFNCPTKDSCPKFIVPVTKDKKGLNRAHFGGSGMLQ